MEIALLTAFAFYFLILLFIGYLAYRQSQKTADYTLGNRSLSYWVTALAAHASDMSGWLFMGLPAFVYTRGLIEVWTAVGLTFFMFLNWRLVAPKLRQSSEQFHASTLSSFFEQRFHDTTGILRIVSALFSLLYFAFYIAVGLVVLGLLFESIFNINYLFGIIIGTGIVFYTLLGGYLSISWIDFFQGNFLLVAIIITPLIALTKINGFNDINSAAHLKNVSLSIIPSWSFEGLKEIFFTAAGWGLGYFGQPHILTKFMGIHDVKKIRNAQWVGIGWQIITLFASICVGLIGLAFYKEGIADSQLIFVEMVRNLFPVFIAGLILCAIIAAAINVMSAQVLVSASIIAEDFYKKITRKQNTQAIAWVSRISVFMICCIAGIIAFYSKEKKIYHLVHYAWTGLGCSFGPLLLISLHSKINNKWAAIAGIIAGGVCAGLWPMDSSVPAMIPGFTISFVVILLIAYWPKFNVYQCCCKKG